MNPSKPKRPLGLTLAIFASMMLFSIVPLAQTLFVLGINGYQGQGDSGIVSGISISNFDPVPYLTRAFLAFLFLALCIFTGLGRPRAMRFIFPIGVFLFGGSVILSQILPAFITPVTLEEGIDSGVPLRQTVQWGYFFMILTVTTYSIWFANRWSSRAFFRGHYTEKDLELMRAALE